VHRVVKDDNTVRRSSFADCYAGSARRALQAATPT
jgi:hypothetical protein